MYAKRNKNAYSVHFSVVETNILILFNFYELKLCCNDIIENIGLIIV